jgi:hypothetical protein
LTRCGGVSPADAVLFSGVKSSSLSSVSRSQSSGINRNLGVLWFWTLRTSPFRLSRRADQKFHKTHHTHQTEMTTATMSSAAIQFLLFASAFFLSTISAKHNGGAAFVTTRVASKPSSSSTLINLVKHPSSLPTRQEASTSRLYLEQISPKGEHHHEDRNNPPTTQWSSAAGGGGGDSKQSSTELSASFSNSNTGALMDYKIFCDLDGVLVDFDYGVKSLLNSHPSKLIKGTMWKHIARANAFYEHLPWKSDGKKLWRVLKPLTPDILTGVPYPKSSRVEKYNWCQRELGLDDELKLELNHVDMAAGCRDHEIVNGNSRKEGVTNVITCWSNNKYCESGYKA